MPRSGTDHLTQAEELVEEETETPAEPVDPKRAQRLAALQKAQASRMAKAELKRKEKAVADYESLQRKEDISRKFDELQERLGNKPKAQPPLEEESDEEPVRIKPKAKVTPSQKKVKPKPKKKVIVEEEYSTSESDDDEPVVIVKRKKKAKPKRKVVYEAESEVDSEDEYLHRVQSKAAQYYKLMF